MNFGGVTVLCLGDLMLDQFVYGDVERISPEAPVPVLRLRETRSMLGGAGNVAANIASLGGRAILIGLAGEDDGAAALGRHAAALGRKDVGGGAGGVEARIVATRLRPTIRKTRYLAQQQQVVRADEESALPLQPEEQAGLLAALREALPLAQAVILSDYGKGVLSDTVLAEASRAARAAGLAVFVDPKGEDYARYRGADCITPNLRELALATRRPVNNDAEVQAACLELIRSCGVGAVLATRSGKGMMLVQADGAVHAVPARRREVFDVSGAGDTVIATLALAHASGMDLPRAMRVSNAAAGVVVSKMGTATVQPAELLHELNDDAAALPAGRSALRSTDEAAALVAHWKEQGLTVGFTNGCFDILHAGHVSLLAFARGCCDRLVVALNTDASVAQLKGAERPLNQLDQRAQVVGAIKYVDCVVAFGEDTPLALIEQLLPDRLVKGADYRPDQVVGAEVVQRHGGQVVLCDLVAGQSTTGLVHRIRLAS